MNFLDAHIIVHDYFGSLAKLPDAKALLFRRKSDLKNTKDEIIDAYKLFYAHMLFYCTRSQEEYVQYEMSREWLNCFVDDDKYFDVIRCNILVNESKSFFGKLKNHNALPQAQEKINNYLQESHDLLNDKYRYEEVDEYFDIMKKKIDEIKEIFKDEEEAFGEVSDKTFNEYSIDFFFTSYEKAHIKVDETDIAFFYPFETLRNLIENPDSCNIYYKYKNYIKTHK